MSETTKCAGCDGEGKSLCATCRAFVQRERDDTIRPAAPSPEAGERAWLDSLADKALADTDYLQGAEDAAAEAVGNLVEYLLSRRAPRVEAGEVTEEMVEAFAEAYRKAIGVIVLADGNHGIREALTAALRTGAR